MTTTTTTTPTSGNNNDDNNNNNNDYNNINDDNNDSDKHDGNNNNNNNNDNNEDNNNDNNNDKHDGSSSSNNNNLALTLRATLAIFSGPRLPQSAHLRKIRGPRRGWPVEDSPGRQAIAAETGSRGIRTPWHVCMSTAMVMYSDRHHAAVMPRRGLATPSHREVACSRSLAPMLGALRTYVCGFCIVCVHCNGYVLRPNPAWYCMPIIL